MATATNGSRTEVPRSAPMRGVEPEPYKGAGFVLFAAIMLAVSATLNVIWGIAAIDDSKFFVGGASYILSGLNTWGWIVLCFGVVEAFVALSVWRGGTFGRWLGIAIAGLAIVAALMSIPAYPFWSLTLVAIDVAVIYALAVYGGKPELTP